MTEDWLVSLTLPRPWSSGHPHLSAPLVSDRLEHRSINLTQVGVDVLVPFRHGPLTDLNDAKPLQRVGKYLWRELGVTSKTLLRFRRDGLDHIGDKG